MLLIEYLGIRPPQDKQNLTIREAQILSKYCILFESNSELFASLKTIVNEQHLSGGILIALLLFEACKAANDSTCRWSQSQKKLAAVARSIKSRCAREPPTVVMRPQQRKRAAHHRVAANIQKQQLCFSSCTSVSSSRASRRGEQPVDSGQRANISKQSTLTCHLTQRHSSFDHRRRWRIVASRGFIIATNLAATIEAIHHQRVIQSIAHFLDVGFFTFYMRITNQQARESRELGGGSFCALMA